MKIETKKLRLIEDLLKIKDHILLDKIEALMKHKPSPPAKSSIHKYAGIWSKEEVEEIKKIIEKDCEQIQEEDWK